jgi:hypothetical protein
MDTHAHTHTHTLTHAPRTHTQALHTQTNIDFRQLLRRTAKKGGIEQIRRSKLKVLITDVIT